jgi:hypothetical protein
MRRLRDRCQRPIEVVSPVRDDRRMGEGRDARHVFRGNSLATGSEPGEDLGHADRIPDQHGIGEQTQTAHRVHHLLLVVCPKDTLIGEEEPTGEPMARSPTVELQLGTASQHGVVKVPEHIDHFDHPAQGRQGFGQPLGAMGQPLEDHVRWRLPVSSFVGIEGAPF